MAPQDWRAMPKSKLNMRVPSFAALQMQTVTDGLCHSYAQTMHPNPKFYKYSWWIFWRQSACDGHEFLDQKHSLCTADAMALSKKLSLEQERHWIYNRQIPRDEPGVTPFERMSSKWRNSHFAPSFGDDTDCEWEGHR